MSILKAIAINHFEYKEKRNWDKTYWFLDLHSTILKPNYSVGNIPTEFYPYAKETLQLLTKLSDVVLIMYTCSHPNEIEEYINFFESNNIHFDYINENPEVITDTNGYGCYDKKPYINVLLDDKAGFSGEEDWVLVLNLMKEKYPNIK